MTVQTEIAFRLELNLYDGKNICAVINDRR